MTKSFNFALKIKGGGREGGTCEVLRPCHPPPENLERAQNIFPPQFQIFLIIFINFNRKVCIL